MALAGLAIAFLFSGPETMQTKPYQGLFSVVPRWAWGWLGLIFGAIGFYGLYFRNKAAWLASHGFGIVIFVSLAIFFWQAGSSTGGTTYAALGLNAWLRYTDRYQDPDFDSRR